MARIRNMPGRIRRRGGDLASVEALVPEINTEPRVERVDHDGIRWINIERPGPTEAAWLQENFDFHALDIEDVLSRNQRPKIDEYDDYLFLVLHLPVFDQRVGRLNAGELDIFVGPDYVVTIPNQPLQPVEYLFERCAPARSCASSSSPRAPATCSTDRRRQLRLLLPDAAQDRQQARRDRGRHLLEGRSRGGRARHLQRQAGDHQLPQGDPAAAAGAARPREGQAALPRPDLDLEIYFDDIVDAHERIWDMLENYKEVVDALEETNESVISHRVNDDPARADGRSASSSCR